MARPTSPRSSRARWRTLWNSTLLYRSVAAGSVVGGVLRYLVSITLQGQLGAAFPWSTLFINVTGSLFIGFYAALTGPDGRLFVRSHTRQLVMTGICGGYTTFSAFSLETLRLAQSGDVQAAALYVAISIVGWMAAVWLGHALATRLNRLRGT